MPLLLQFLFSEHMLASPITWVSPPFPPFQPALTCLLKGSRLTTSAHARAMLPGSTEPWAPEPVRHKASSQNESNLPLGQILVEVCQHDTLWVNPNCALQTLGRGCRGSLWDSCRTQWSLQPWLPSSLSHLGEKPLLPSFVQANPIF